MQRAYDTIVAMIRDGARHRKGFLLSDVKPDFILDQAEDELHELIAAPDDPDELADVMACLIHYAIKKGWSIVDIEKRMLNKFLERFNHANS